MRGLQILGRDLAVEAVGAGGAAEPGGIAFVFGPGGELPLEDLEVALEAGAEIAGAVAKSASMARRGAPVPPRSRRRR